MKIKTNLYRQLVSIVIIICGIIFISLGLLLPNLMLPIYEKHVYQYLKYPLEFVDNSKIIDNDIAYLYVDDKIYTSNNLNNIIDIDSNKILSYIDSEKGKFKYLNQTYYYYTIKDNNTLKVAITNSNYIKQIRKDIKSILLPILLGTLFIAVSLVILWTRNLIKKIEYLKEKVENIDNDNYKPKTFKLEDELNVLSSAIDKMKITLKKQDEYKNQMYQNISHDFKTPLTVIKSYAEAIDDGVVSKEEGSKVIRKQIDKLELKVHSLLYLNKLVYLKDNIKNTKEKINVKPIINLSISKFKLQNKNIEFIFNTSGKTIFTGTYDMWEAIIDNLLSNFVRYAKKTIKITIKNNKITLYNDGANVDENILNDLFTPYKKGITGQFGLGLSIVKKTLSLLGYEISVTNEKIGVSFIIK
jgi:two-component system sensor histidine kinase CssS